ncbi:uncharacterized protein BKCO1_37000105 [Diplodia corticola]|uniref:Uncharacterized protein n=1 Tax=Diplodia corticola TaxID=236234 RepID=A0A1J9QXC1_9PEZI|nr:uncharacterized protein BKCO1_37000105 [Diplodia corticola]OJD32634.1 hypothetical protein BKCO1_37000105 [Diplodia corticola]
MCRTILTVVDHACRAEHLTRRTRTEQCYAAHLWGIRVCAPGPPRHMFYEQHMPGAACQSCFYADRAAYNTPYNLTHDNDVEDDYEVDPATLHNQRLLSGLSSTPVYPPPIVPRPPTILPGPVNPPYLGTDEHTHEDTPYSGPAIPTGVPGARIDWPLIDTIAQQLPGSLEQRQWQQQQQLGEYPSGYAAAAAHRQQQEEEEAWNSGMPPPPPPPPPPPFRGGPLVTIAEDEREHHHHHHRRHPDNFDGPPSTEPSGEEDDDGFVRVERPTTGRRFGREPRPPRHNPPLRRRFRQHPTARATRNPSLPSFRPYSPSPPLPPPPPSSSSSEFSGYRSPHNVCHLRGGGGDSADEENESSSSSFEENEEEEETKQLRSALERSAREYAEAAEAAESAALERAMRESADECERACEEAERAALERAMGESVAEAEGERKRAEEEVQREVVGRSLGTWREEVRRRMGRGSGEEREEVVVEGGGRGGVRGEAGRGGVAEGWGLRRQMDRRQGRGVGSDCDAGCGKKTAAWTAPLVSESNHFEEDRAVQGPYADFSPRVHSNPTPASRRHVVHTPAQRRAYPPPPTVEDEESEPDRPATWSFEGVVEKEQEKDDDDDVSTIMDPATEVTRAMEAVDISLDHVREKRMARFAKHGEE